MSQIPVLQKLCLKFVFKSSDFNFLNEKKKKMKYEVKN